MQLYISIMSFPFLKIGAELSKNICNDIVAPLLMLKRIAEFNFILDMTRARCINNMTGKISFLMPNGISQFYCRFF